MATSKQDTFLAEEYHSCAGCILFRFTPDPQICLLRSRRSSEVVLPKGHKDLGESLEEAALRETYEETGWRCEFLPVNLLTRVPPPGHASGDAPRMASAVKGEAIAVTLRHMDKSGRNVKFVWWFVAQVTGSTRDEGTQMANENFDVEWVAADDAVKVLSRPGDKDAAAQAVKLISESRGITNSSL
ncbi:hypothetical protein FRB94_003701 [Tulasnella sp. JGI-2019a]|nr:hypothetical protein FRB93_005487 [Tulasnella sp. JGI-2019a]KAG9002666.1 hypothetical protein FRB94_003701 [Tulasnella sp. JGI-2019a]